MAVLRSISGPLSEAVLLVAAIVATIAITGAILYNASFISNEIVSLSADASRQIGERIVFVYGFYNSSSGCHYLYFKNVGDTVIASIGSSTLILGNYTYSILLFYNETGATPYCGCWSYTEVENNNTLWEPRETIVVVACPPTSIESPYKFIFTLPSGVKISDTYRG